MEKIIKKKILNNCKTNCIPFIKDYFSLFFQFSAASAAWCCWQHVFTFFGLLLLLLFIHQPNVVSVSVIIIIIIIESSSCCKNTQICLNYNVSCVEYSDVLLQVLVFFCSFQNCVQSFTFFVCIPLSKFLLLFFILQCFQAFFEGATIKHGICFVSFLYFFLLYFAEEES